MSNSLKDIGLSREELKAITEITGIKVCLKVSY